MALVACLPLTLTSPARAEDAPPASSGDGGGGGWRDHDPHEVFLWGAQVGVTPSFGGRSDSAYNLQLGVQERFDTCNFDGYCGTFSGIGMAYGVVFLGVVFYDIATGLTGEPTAAAANAVGNNPLIDTDMGWLFGVTDTLGVGFGAYTALQGTQLSDNPALEGKFGAAGTFMYTGLPVLLRGRLYAAIVAEGENGSVLAGAQGGNASVYLHVFDSWLFADVGPFVTAGYEVDLTDTGKTVFRFNTALGLSFL